MRRVAVDDVNATVDQPVGKPDVLGRHLVSPIGTPMDRGNSDVLAPPGFSDPLLDCRGGFIRKIEQEVDARTIFGCSPARGNAARSRSESMDDDFEGDSPIDHGGQAGLRERPARPGSLQPNPVKRLQCLGEPRITIIEHMVVCEDTDIDSRRRQGTRRFSDACGS